MPAAVADDRGQLDRGVIVAVTVTTAADILTLVEEGPRRPDRMRPVARDIVNKRNLSLVFEVNDPVRDPHMIAYDKPHIVLLDAIRREEVFARVAYEELEQIAGMLGVAVKQPGPAFRTWKDFQGWLKAVQREGRLYQWRDQHIEGFVAEDLGGFQFKIKLDYYSFWKWMRSQRDRVRRAREKGLPLPAPPDDHQGLAFYEWLIAQSDEALQLDIIQLRDTFETEHAID